MAFILQIGDFNLPATNPIGCNVKWKGQVHIGCRRNHMIWYKKIKYTLQDKE